MRHIIILVNPIISIPYVFNEFYEIIRNEFSDFWRRAIFTRSRTVVLNDCRITLHFIKEESPRDLIGVKPFKIYQLNYSGHSAISRLAYDIIKDCSRDDLTTTKEFLNGIYNAEYLGEIKGGYHVYPEKVIFNKPATVVIWNDGVKTVVKCQKGDKYDPEKGLAMAYVKRLCGLKEFYKSMELGGK